ncbi:MAG: leucine-rich repeat domain-containing protein [Phycisphaerales bacterium]
MCRLLFVLVLSAFLLDGAQAEEAVFFEDPNLKAVIEEALWITDPTPTNMLDLISLSAGAKQIESLVGIEYATNLRDLYLRYNRIRDLSPLAGLTNLETLILHRTWLDSLSPLSGLTRLSCLDLNTTHISDISALSGLYELTKLDLRNNEVSDISALSGLANLDELVLERNQVTDVSALLGLTCLSYLNLAYNPLSDEAYDVQIPQIIANNPGIEIHHDGKKHIVTLSSSVGGSVVDPGEGVFSYPYVEWLRLEAKADPGYVFSGWTGTLYTKENPTLIAIEQDHEICAVFTSLMSEFHVDDDAPNDPDPGSPDTGDPQEDGTIDHPFDSIQEAINVAGDGAAIFVRPGTYRENITVSGKSIRLTGREPNDPNGTELPVIRADHNGVVVLIAGNGDTHCTLSGFAITAGTGQAGIISCSGGTATISHCLVAGNRLTGFDSALIKCSNSDATLVHCTIADNHVGGCGGAIRATASTVTVTNSILYHNTYNYSSATGGNFYMDDAADITITYSNIQNGWSDTGNLDEDPLFIRRGQWTDPANPLIPRNPTDSSAVCLMGDYHLLSQTGRWDASAMDWLCDEAASPCIDAGDPAGEVGCEPVPNGKIVNMGVYGGTTEASKSY